MSNASLPKSAAGAAIRGPRRVRQTDLPPEPTVEVHAEPSRKLVTAKMQRVSLPDSTVEIARPARRGIMRKTAWFLGGLMIGALVVALVRGDLVQSARAWGANALRSFKTSTTSGPAPAQLAATVAAPKPPCAVESEDPCDALMAPFRDQVAGAPVVPTENVPTVRIEDLPRVRPPVVWVARPKPAATATREGEADSLVAEDQEIAPAAPPAPSPTTATPPALTAAPAPEPSTQAANAFAY